MSRPGCARSLAWLGLLAGLVAPACGGDDFTAVVPDMEAGAGTGGAGGTTDASAGSGGQSGAGTAGSGGVGAGGGFGGAAGDAGNPCRQPFHAPGVTAAWSGPSNTTYIISEDRYWILTIQGWAGAGRLEDLLPPNAPHVDNKLPWDQPGLTAAWENPNQTTHITLVQEGNRYWHMLRDPATWKDSSAWTQAGKLSETWSTAPELQGRKPFDPPGVSAGFLPLNEIGRLVVFSVDRAWEFSGGAWTAYLLADQAPWSQTASVGTGRVWEGLGVTAIANISPTNTLLLSGARYWTLDVNDSLGQSGNLAQIWQAAPCAN